MAQAKMGGCGAVGQASVVKSLQCKITRQCMAGLTAAAAATTALRSVYAGGIRVLRDEGACGGGDDGGAAGRRAAQHLAADVGGAGGAGEGGAHLEGPRRAGAANQLR